MSPASGIHLFALVGHNEMPYWEANQRLALYGARHAKASPGSSPTPLEVGVEWHYTFGRVNPLEYPISADMENHPMVSSPPCTFDAQGQSSYLSSAVDRGAETGAELPEDRQSGLLRIASPFGDSAFGAEGDRFVHLGPDESRCWMVHCFSCCTFSFSTEACCHQPFPSVRFYLINARRTTP
jgi:hypothetical protein